MPATTEGWRNSFAKVLCLLPGCVDAVDAMSSDRFDGVGSLPHIYSTGRFRKLSNATGKYV